MKTIAESMKNEIAKRKARGASRAARRSGTGSRRATPAGATPAG